MAEQEQLKAAQNVFKSLCKALDDLDWHYERDDEKLVVKFGVSGEDIPMKFIIQTDVQRQLVRLSSYLPFEMASDKRAEGAAATSYANYKLADGSFDYDIHDGSIFFRMTSSFRDSLIGKDVLEYMVHCACYTVDKYNDKFLMLSKGMLSLEDFVKAV